MRLAVISDVHGNLPALTAVLSHLGTRGVDFTVNLGDCVSGPLWPRETAETLAALAFPTVRGNHDRWLAEPRAGEPPIVGRTRELAGDAGLAWLDRLPATLTIAGEILALHGTPASDEEFLLEDSVDDRLCLATSAQVSERLGDRTASLVLCGHSHLQHVVVSGDRLVVNPGSVGGPRNAGNPVPARHEAGSPHARYAIVTRTHGTWSAELFVIAYDWTVVAARAVALGDPAWADGFLRSA